MLEESINTLIADSTTPPVIILQTDTGPLFKKGSDTFKILNALLHRRIFGPRRSRVRRANREAAEQHAEQGEGEE